MRDPMRSPSKDGDASRKLSPLSLSLELFASAIDLSYVVSIRSADLGPQLWRASFSV